MYFDNISDLLNMSGYGVYVWPCYLLTLLAVIYLLLTPLIKHARIVRIIQQATRRQQRGQQSRNHVNKPDSAPD